MTDKSFPLYQWDTTVNRDMYHVRSDDWQTFLDAKSNIIDMLLGDVTPDEEPPPPIEEPISTSVSTPIAAIKDKVCPKCGEADYWVNLVKKEGENKGRHFKVCKNKDCGEFLGFTTEPLSRG